MSALIVIPARLSSTRFPNKPMAIIRGRSMIERVWRMAQSLECRKRVIIATDEQALADFAAKFGAESVITSSKCRTGTDRSAEAYQKLKFEADAVISLQADAVLTPPWVVEEVIALHKADPQLDIITPATRLSGRALEEYIASKEKGSSTGTTVVCDKFGRALYFSKGIIPACRNSQERGSLLRHIGLYLYKPQTLLELSRMAESPLEKIEKLEQLRALENGMAIHVVEVDYRGRTHASVDNPEDVAVVEAIIDREGDLCPL